MRDTGRTHAERTTAELDFLMLSVRTNHDDEAAICTEEYMKGKPKENSEGWYDGQ